MANISIDQLTNEIVKAVQEYTTEIEEKVQQASDDVTKEGVKLLKQKSPKLTGNYAKGWARKKQGKGYIIHNKTDYQLTHLLEYGHVKRGGGRVQAKVHIRPVEEQIVREFENRVEKVIKG